jgi:hypothetical protein
MRTPGLRVLATAVVVVALAACSDSGSSDKPVSSGSSSSGPVVAEKPAASISLTGDGGLNGAVTDVSVRCDFPDLDGDSIAVLGKAYDPATSVLVAVFGTKVTVRLFGTGSDGGYVQRDFEGTGVTDFDVRTGATIDSSLKEVAASNQSVSSGALGAVSSVKGSLQCNGQQPGTSELTLTGETVEGAVNGAKLEHARVECNRDAAGDEAVVLGLLTVGSVQAFVSIGLRTDGVSVSETLDTGRQHRYQGPPGSATPTPTGGHANGDAVEQGATPPHTLHVAGEATCGTPVTG